MFSWRARCLNFLVLHHFFITTGKSSMFNISKSWKIIACQFISPKDKDVCKQVIKLRCKQRIFLGVMYNKKKLYLWHYCDFLSVVRQILDCPVWIKIQCNAINYEYFSLFIAQCQVARIKPSFLIYGRAASCLHEIENFVNSENSFNGGWDFSINFQIHRKN